MVAIFGTSTRPDWVHFYFPSCSWGLKLHCSLLGSFIFIFCLLIHLITRWMILWKYVIVDLAIILLGCFIFPTLFITCCSSLSNFPVLFWQSMSNVYFWYFHNIFLLIIEETSCSSYFVSGNFNPNHLSNYLLIYIYIVYESPKVLQRPAFKW